MRACRRLCRSLLPLETSACPAGCLPAKLQSIPRASKQARGWRQELALFGPRAISELSPQLAAKRPSLARHARSARRLSQSAPVSFGRMGGSGAGKDQLFNLRCCAVEKTRTSGPHRRCRLFRYWRPKSSPKFATSSLSLGAAPAGPRPTCNTAACLNRARRIGDTRCRRVIPAVVRDLSPSFRAGALGYKPAQPLMSLSRGRG